MFIDGFQMDSFSLGPAIRELVREEKWSEIEQEFSRLTSPGGLVFDQLLKVHSFSKIEIMLSIRDSKNDWEEDGIWHDDGSRLFAFSLSLTENAHEIEGGNLEIRKTNSHGESVCIPTPEFGITILFLTGVRGFEHRTRKVKKGRRIILVGWCS